MVGFVAVFVVLVVALGLSIALATAAPHYRTIACKEAKRREEAQQRIDILEASLTEIKRFAARATDVDPSAAITVDIIQQLEK